MPPTTCRSRASQETTRRAPTMPIASDERARRSRGEGRRRRDGCARGSPRCSPPSLRLRRRRKRCAAGRRRCRVLAFLEHRTARSSALDHRAAAALADSHRRTARARCVLVCAARSAALRAGACRSRSRSRPNAPPRPSLRVQPVAGRATPVALISSSSGSKKAACSPAATEDPGAARRRARSASPATCGARPTASTKRCTGAERLAVVETAHARRLQLLVPRHARVPRDVRRRG